MVTNRSRKIMKRRGRRNNKDTKEKFSSSNIESLPNELLTEVVARVASCSFKSYINIKLSCKVFHEIAKERYVYQNATMADFPIEPSWERNKQEKINKLTSFMELCRESGNTEALYRKGVMDLFKNERTEVAKELLKKAANGGHLGALYVIGIIMIFMGGDVKEKGVMLIGGMKKREPLRTIARDCRKSLIEILENIWVKNPHVLGQRPTRCTLQHQRSRTNGWSSWPPIDSDDEDADFHCDACICDVEIAHVISALPAYSY
ncbi:F-box protein At2g35280-like [Nicotiana tabacum]|uniref:F-box protein At2g35280-like n=1 Tax=Nicotiana tabacum TaxID=4097 RepID=A0AC58SJM9_TOBAC|nr:putative F-box protein At1g67623 [Nicotiana tomentosiformis]